MTNLLLWWRKRRARRAKRADAKKWHWAKNRVVATGELVYIATSEGEFNLFLRDGGQVELDMLAPNESVCSAHPLTNKHILIRKVSEARARFKLPEGVEL